MSLSELKNILSTIRQSSNGLISNFHSEVSLKDGISFSKDGYIYIQLSKGERRKYTVEKFFIHQSHRLSQRDVSEAVSRLKDLLLLIKLERGELKVKEILRCRNVLIRRYLLERVGYERFIEELGCKVIDRNGEDELIAIPLRRDEEPIFLVKVRDVSSKAYYMLRVPPNVKTCREAIAWTFGLSSEEYKPVKET